MESCNVQGGSCLIACVNGGVHTVIASGVRVFLSALSTGEWHTK